MKASVIHMNTEQKKFCAHRGVSALMPENTLPALAAALALGADEIEFDVRPVLRNVRLRYPYSL